MKAKVLGFSAVLALLLLATRTPREPAVPAAAPANEPALPSETAHVPTPTAEPARLSALPQLSSHRVSEQVTETGVKVGGVKYQAEVDAQGLRFATRGHEVRLKGVALEQGGVSAPLKDAPAQRERFARASIDRGAMTEAYVFENTRVEQLFRVHEALGEGALRVHVQVEGDLKGTLETLPSRQGVALGTLEDGSRLVYDGALAYDAAGRREALQPRIEHNRIVLEVSAGFMAKAAWPVVVDPWLEIDLSATSGGVSETPTVSQTPALAIEGGGNAYIAWAEEVGIGAAKRFKIYLRYWNGFEWRAQGESFGGNGLSGTTGNATNPSLAVTATGTVFIAWQDDSNGNFEIYLKQWTGSAWVELGGSASLGGLSNSSGESYFPSVAFMTSRIPSTQIISTVPVVAWQDSSTGSTQIHVAAFFQGDSGRRDDTLTGIYENFPVIPAGWYAPGNISPVAAAAITATPVGYVSERPKLQVSEGVGGINRTISVVWQDTRDDNYEIYFTQATLTNDPITFLLVQPIPGPVDPNQTPISPGQTQPIWCRTTTVFPLTNVSSTTTLSTHPSLAINATNGDIWIAWEEGIDLTHSQIEVSLNLGASVTASDPLPLLTPHRSITPSVGASGNFGYVAWSDDEPGNSEIYVKRSPNNVLWSSVGFDPSFGISTTGLGGISRTFGASLFPVIQAGASVTVAWQDFSNGSFDTYLRRYYENEPRQLRQTTPAAASVIAFGGNTTNQVIELRGQVFSEDTNRSVLMEVEIRPITSAFVGRPTLTGELIAVDLVTHMGLSEAAVVFTGAVNTQYHWRARTVDDIGRRSAWISAGPNLDGALDFEVSAIPIPPEPPSNLVAAANGLLINLTWTAPPGGQTLTYHVYRSTTSPVSLVSGNRVASGLTSVSYSDINALSGGTTYFYVVTAVDIAGQESLGSNEATATTPSAPGAVAGLLATSGPGQIALTWTPLVGATSYTVLRRGPMPTGAPFSVIAAGITLPSYTDSGLPPSSTFEYQVFAVNGVGNGPNSGTASATTPVMSVAAPPTTLTGTPGIGQATLSWTSPIGGPFTFNIYRSTTSGGPYTAVATGIPTTTYTDSGLTGSTGYYYVVTAVNGLGESTYSNQVLITTPPTVIVGFSVPTTPANLNAVAGTGQVFLSWAASTGSAPITYHIGRSTTAGGPYTEIGTTVNTTTFVDTTAPQGTPVFYVIFASNTAGASADSSEVGATVSLAPLPAPVNLVASTGGPSTVDLSWTAPVGAGLVVYNVKRSATSGGPYTTIATGVIVTNYTATSNATEIFYVVTAQNGLGESAPSNEVQEVPDVPFEGEDKDNCGLLGIEFLLVMGALALRRRRTRA